MWTLTKLWSGHLGRDEGIRFPGRILVGQVAQIVVTAMLSLFAVKFIVSTGEMIDERRQELGSSYTQSDVDAISNVDWATVTVDQLYVTEEEQTALDLMSSISQDP